MNRPIFVQGNLAFGLDANVLEFNNKNLSVYGVTGLQWHPLSPEQHFGANVTVDVRIPLKETVSFSTRASILREQTTFTDQMALRFDHTEETHDQLEETIHKFGFFPTNYLRKYPRIPASSSLRTFPLQVIGHPVKVIPTEEEPPIIFSVANLSLGGVLLSTQNPFSLSIHPGLEMKLYLEPRGDFSVQIHVIGKVRRILEERDPISGNLHRLFGVKFTGVDEENKVAFLELVKDILAQISARR